jgi:hypothetical protein
MVRGADSHGLKYGYRKDGSLPWATTGPTKEDRLKLTAGFEHT